METSAIRYRVADFLKQHPPFDAFSETDRLALVAQGRVRFHEVDERLYAQGQPHGPFVSVIQQGSVSLWDESGSAPRLVDVRGPGDLLGVDRFLGRESHRHTARAMSDLVLYAVPSSELQRLLGVYPDAGLYLAAHFTVNAHPDAADPHRRAHEKTARDFVVSGQDLVLGAHEPLATAARRLLDADVLGAAVVDEAGVVAGLVDARGLLEALARGGLPAEATVGQAMTEPATLPADATLDQCLFALAERDTVAVVEGAHPSRFIGLISRARVARAFGEQPADLARAAASAHSLDRLRSVHERFRIFLLEQLGSPRAVDFAARLAARFDRIVIERVLHMTGDGEAREGLGLFLFGASGRGESLTALPPLVGAIHAESANGEARATARLRELQAALLEAGYRAPEGPPDAAQFRCASLRAWCDRFATWMRDPVENRLHLARPLFDLAPLAGPPELFAALERSVQQGASGELLFLRLLAHDCLASLPPLSFFKEYVIEETGEHGEVLHLERSALRPLVDVGRVFGIASGRALGGSTLERFARAEAYRPEERALFREAAETFRVLLYHQARAGLRHRDGGFEIRPQGLSRHDRRVLKTSFRSIARLIDFTARGDWLRA